MFSLTRLAVLLTAAISVAAMPSHLARQAHHHREIAARVVQPELAAREMPLPAKRVVRKKRARSGRCSSGSSEVPLPSSTPVDDPQSSPTPQGNERKQPPATSTPTQDPPSTPTVDAEPKTSTPAQPDPNASPDPTPTPTTTPTLAPTPSPSPSPTSGTGDGQIHTGQGTFYATGLGACGITNNDSQDIAAVSYLFYDSFPGYDGTNPNNNPMCGKTAKVTYQGVTITVVLTDRCTGCAMDDLDFSPHAFNQLADPTVGRISGIQWEIID